MPPAARGLPIIIARQPPIACVRPAVCGSITQSPSRREVIGILRRQSLGKSFKVMSTPRERRPGGTRSAASSAIVFKRATRPEREAPEAAPT